MVIKTLLPELHIQFATIFKVFKVGTGEIHMSNHGADITKNNGK
jgi:hypothetical protein